MTQTPSFRLTFLDILSRGPAVAVVDPNHAGHHDLPQRVRGGALLVPVADFDDRVSLTAETTLALEFLDHGEVRTAQLDWRGVFAMTGTNQLGQYGGVMAGQALPGWLGEPLPLRAQQLISQLGVGPAPQPEWNINLHQQLVLDDADRSGWQPDRKAAVEALLARGDGRVRVLINRADEGLIVPSKLPPGEVTQGEFARAMQPLMLQVTGDHLRWRTVLAGEFSEFVVPWSAVIALADPAGVGWFWPCALPMTATQQMRLEQHATFEKLMALEGVPLPPAEKIAPVPTFGLRVPPETDKQLAIQRCLRLGNSVVLADLRKIARANLHPALHDSTITAMPLAMPGWDSQVTVTADHVTLSVPDHVHQSFRLTIPLQSVLAAASQFVSGRVYTWPDDYPDELAYWSFQAADHSKRGMQAASQGMTAIDRTGTALGAALDASGEWAVALSQPFGPPVFNGQQARFNMHLPPDLPRLQ